jgi:hypothetical protein
MEAKSKSKDDSPFFHLDRSMIKKLARPYSKGFQEPIDFTPLGLPLGEDVPRIVRNVAPGEIFERSNHKLFTNLYSNLPNVHKFDEGRQVAKELKQADEFPLIHHANIPDYIRVSPYPRRQKLVATRLPQLSPRSLNFSVTRMDYPWRTIGKLTVTGLYRPFRIFGDNTPFTVTSSGTATVINRSLLLTASHVLPWGADDYWGTFTPALSQVVPQMPFGVYYVDGFWGTPNVDDVCGWDVSVVHVDRPVGDTTGWMGTYATNNEDFFYNGSFFSGGYQSAYYNGNEMSTAFNLKVSDIDNDSGDSKEIELDWFTNNGWSGGPLFTWLDQRTENISVPGPYVVGVLSGKEDDSWFVPEQTVFSGGLHLGKIVREATAIFP